MLSIWPFVEGKNNYYYRTFRWRGDHVRVGVHFLANLHPENPDKVKSHYSGLFVVRGEGTFLNHDHREWLLYPGVFAQHIPGEWHILRRKDVSLWCECSLSLDETLFLLLRDLGIIPDSSPVLTPPNWQERVTELAHLQKILQTQTDLPFPVLLVTLEAFFLKIFFPTSSNRSSFYSLPDERLEKIANELCQSFHKAIDYRELAKRYHFSYSHLRRLFKKKFGVSLHSYRNQAKMDLARFYLEDSNMKIGEIAETLGYQSIFSFSRHFRQFYQMSPQEYRKKMNPS